MDINNPASCFRKLPLGEPAKFPMASDYEYWIKNIHQQRCLDLGIEGHSDARITSDVNLKGGRLLVMEPQSTLSDGVCEITTNSLLDGDNFPPHGLWVSYAVFEHGLEFAGRKGFRGMAQNGFLLSYIPKPFVEVIQKGINANAEECIYWLDGADSSNRLKRTWGTVCGTP